MVQITLITSSLLTMSLTVGPISIVPGVPTMRNLIVLPGATTRRTSGLGTPGKGLVVDLTTMATIVIVISDDNNKKQ